LRIEESREMADLRLANGTVAHGRNIRVTRTYGGNQSYGNNGHHHHHNGHNGGRTVVNNIFGNGFGYGANPMAMASRSLMDPFAMHGMVNPMMNPMMGGMMNPMMGGMGVNPFAMNYDNGMNSYSMMTPNGFMAGTAPQGNSVLGGISGTFGKVANAAGLASIATGALDGLFGLFGGGKSEGKKSGLLGLGILGIL
jgi:hypothetical protein